MPQQETHTTASRLVLLIDDNPARASAFQSGLPSHEFRAQIATDGFQGLRQFRVARPDLVVVHLLLPDMNGTQVLDAIRRERTTPVILMIGAGHAADSSLDSEFIPDDYLFEPFAPRELAARLRAVVHRTVLEPKVGTLFQIGPLRIDSARQIARFADRRLELTMTEFKLLEHMARHVGVIWSREQLFRAARIHSGKERIVDTHMSNLRTKLKGAGVPELLETVRGYGYRMWDESRSAV